MRANTIQSVTYDPSAQRLTYLNNNKPVGGLVGKVAEATFMEMLDTGKEIKLMAMNSKSQKVRRLRALWIKQGIDQHRASILEPYGVSSTAALNERQLDTLITRFTKKNDYPVQIRRARSKVIMLLQDLGVYKNDGNWDRVNDYLMDPRIAGKLLYQMSEMELNALSLKLRSILSKKPKFNPSNN